MQLEEEKAEKEKKKHGRRRNKEKGVAIAREDREKGRSKGRERDGAGDLRQEDIRGNERAREGRDSPVTSRLRSHTCVRLKSATYFASRHMLQKVEATRVHSRRYTGHNSLLPYRQFLSRRFPNAPFPSLASIDMTRGLMHVSS